MRLATGSCVIHNGQLFDGNGTPCIPQGMLIAEQGRITYANDVFLRVAGYSEKEVIGSAHSLVRHPDMPRSVFKLLWDTIQQRHEIFAYVNNLACNGDNYWVLAHVTPSVGRDGRVVGYHSNRRVPDRAAVAVVDGLYAQLREEERRQGEKVPV